MNINLEETIISRKKNAERLFSACVLVQAEFIKHECGWLQPAVFSHEQYRDFWKAVQEGTEPAEAAIKLKIYGELAAAQAEVVSSLEFGAFARIIAEDDYMIRTAKVLPKIAKAINESNSEDLNKAIQALSENKQSKRTTVKSAVDVGLEFSELLGADNLAIKTGIHPYDKMTGGLAFRALHLIAARPSVGKTTLAFQISRNIAVRSKKVIYFSPEQSATALWAKAACGASGVPWAKVKANTLTQEEHTRLIETSGDLMNAYGEFLLIDDRSRITSEDIWQTVSQEKPAAIVVDHLSLLADKNENQVERLGQITWSGKQIAKEYNLVAIYLQQLSRAVTQRNDKRPQLTDLRDSGHTEENADTVTFIHREDYYDDPTDTPMLWSRTNLIVAKDRDGERNIEAITMYNTSKQWFYSTQEAREQGA